MTSVTASTPFADSDVQLLTESIWSAVLALSVRRLPAARGVDESGAVITGCIQITGDWEGAVLLDCPVSLARRAAESVFASEPTALTVAHLKDAVGELTNIHGGNLKALLPGACYLSLPAVVHGLEHSLRIPGTIVLCRQAYECGSDVFVLTILGRSNGSR